MPIFGVKLGGGVGFFCHLARTIRGSIRVKKTVGQPDSQPKKGGVFGIIIKRQKIFKIQEIAQGNHLYKF